MAHRGRMIRFDPNTVQGIEADSQNSLSEKNKRLDVSHSLALSGGQVDKTAGILELMVCAGGIYVSL